MSRGVAAYAAALALVAAIFLLFPGIDLWASGLFYRPESRFFLADWAPVRGIYCCYRSRSGRGCWSMPRSRTIGAAPARRR